MNVGVSAGPRRIAWLGGARNPGLALGMLAVVALGLGGCGTQAGAWRLLTPSNSHVISLAADPHIPALIYAGTDDGVVYRARADATGSAVPGTGIPAGAVVASLMPDPKISGRLLAGTTSGLYRSLHYGDEWSAFSQGLPRGYAALALATTPDDSVTLAGTDSHGVYRSIDDGASWAPASAGLPSSATVSSLVWDPAAGIWWAAVQDTTSGNLFQSSDGGQTWKASTAFVHGGGDLNSLATVALSGGGDVVFVATSTGAYFTRDGAAWSKVGGAVPGSGALAVAAFPGQPGAVVISFGETVWASTDAGASWRIVAQGLTNPVAAVGVARDTNGDVVYYAASSQLARFPTGRTGTSGTTSYFLIALIAATLVGGGYLLSRRARRFGYAMGASDNETTAGPAARARARMEAAQRRSSKATSYQARGRRAGLRQGPATLLPSDLTSRKQTGAPARPEKAAGNGHGDPSKRD
ncbi:MAG TPA: hypothetical protein VF808_04505 [Ktedonobacterales bacterium]